MKLQNECIGDCMIFLESVPTQNNIMNKCF